MNELESKARSKLIVTIDILEGSNKYLEGEILKLKEEIARLTLANAVQRTTIDITQGALEFMKKHPKEFTRSKIKKLY